MYHLLVIRYTRINTTHRVSTTKHAEHEGKLLTSNEQHICQAGTVVFTAGMVVVFTAVKTPICQAPFQGLAQSLAGVLFGNKVEEWKKQQQEKRIKWNS